MVIITKTVQPKIIKLYLWQQEKISDWLRLNVRNVSRPRTKQMKGKQTDTFTSSLRSIEHNQIKTTLVCLQQKWRYQYQTNPICLAPLLCSYKRKGEQMRRRVNKVRFFCLAVKFDKCQLVWRADSSYVILWQSVTVIETPGNLLNPCRGLF